MKKVIVLMMLMAGVTAMAQRGEKGHRGDFKDMSAEQMATLQTKKMTLSLDLTEAQQAKIQALHLKNAQLRKAKMEERKAKMEKEEGAKPSSDERYAMKKERLDEAIAQKAELKKILTNEQYSKWQEMKESRGKHSNGKHRQGKPGEKRGKKLE